MKICLYDLEQAGIIVLDQRGITYFNQVGGCACVKASAKGYFVPISNDPPLDQPELALPERLTELTRDLVGLSVEIANQINQLIMEVSSSDRYEVDFDKLDQCSEAWIYLTVYPGGEYSTFDSDVAFKAVLTWPNSD